jgi:DNA-binding transcriptional LysR family regulator
MKTMQLRHLHSLDLNLLLALDALLDERSVTRAGARLAMTQPAMSRTLGRLRDHFADGLLIRSGRELVLTPRAEELRLPLHDALLGLESVVAGAPRFEPASSRRAFTIATADYGLAVAVPPLLARFAKIASGIDLVVAPQPPDWDERLRVGALDAVLFPRRSATPGIVWSNLFAETFTCLVRRGHPLIRGALSLKQFCAVPQLFVSPAGTARSVVDEALDKKRRERRIALRMQSFLAAPLAVAQSDLLAVVPRRIAERFAEPLGLQVLAPPLAIPGFSLALAWHERMRADAGHLWFRRQLISVLQVEEPYAHDPPSPCPQGRSK